MRLRDGLRLATGGNEAPAGASVLCLVRPEAVRLTAGAGPGPNHFAGWITGAVFLGGRYDCEITLAGGVTLRAEVPAAAASAPPTPGDPTVVVLEQADVVVLAE